MILKKPKKKIKVVRTSLLFVLAMILLLTNHTANRGNFAIASGYDDIIVYVENEPLTVSYGKCTEQRYLDFFMGGTPDETPGYYVSFRTYAGAEDVQTNLKEWWSIFAPNVSRASGPSLTDGRHIVYVVPNSLIASGVKLYINCKTTLDNSIGNDNNGGSDDEGNDSGHQNNSSDSSLRVDFDITNALDDLESSGTFDLSKYPANSKGRASVINFVEYCYSYDTSRQEHFGLYVYLYNPQNRVLNLTAGANRLQMAVNYDSEGNAIDYAKFNLIYCSSGRGEAEYLFYKFKVDTSLKRNDGKTILEWQNSNLRRYNLSSIEITTSGSLNLLDYPVGQSWKFSGYAKGFGVDVNAASTLKVEGEETETISLDVKSTYYRTDYSSLGPGHQNQLNSVYFSIPNIYLEKYKKLQRIKAEWWEYKTKDIIVTSNTDFYDRAKNYVGVSIPKNTYISSIKYALFENYRDTVLGNADWGWNGDYFVGSPLCTEAIYYLFGGNDIPDISKPLSEGTLLNYILDYDRTYNNGILSDSHDGRSIAYKNISADLFLNDVDEGRQRGYNVHDIDAADFDITTMMSYRPGDNDFWTNLEYFGFWDTLFKNYPERLGDDLVDLAPIAAVSDSDVEGSNANISERLYIDESSVNSFRSYYDTAKLKDETVFLFRYAVTDYYSTKLDILKPTALLTPDIIIRDEAYKAQQSVFFDFDIIQLTFNRDGEYHVIPVVSSPLDIAAEPEPPADDAIDGFIQSIERFLSAFDNAVNHIGAFFSGMLDFIGGDSFFNFGIIVVLVILAIIFFPIIVPLIVGMISLIIKLITSIIKAFIRLITMLIKGIADLFARGKA